MYGLQLIIKLKIIGCKNKIQIKIIEVNNLI